MKCCNVVYNVVITQPYDFRQHESIVPKWEELLLFNDDFSKVLQGENDNVIVFFEILDFVTMAVANQNYRRAREKGGWYRIAWAFLRLADGQWR